MKKQLKAPGAGNINMKYGALECGFFRMWEEPEGKVFFAEPHGRWVFSYPVLEGGIISNSSDFFPYPREEIVVILPEEIGISKVRWEHGNN